MQRTPTVAPARVCRSRMPSIIESLSYGVASPSRTCHRRLLPCLRSVFAPPGHFNGPARAGWTRHPTPPWRLAERRASAALMRVNHAGELARAGALSRSGFRNPLPPRQRRHADAAARSESDHLAWCETTPEELAAGRVSSIRLWYAGSFALGAAAAMMGDSRQPGVRGRDRASGRGHSMLTSQTPGERHSQPCDTETMRAEEIAHGARPRLPAAPVCPHGCAPSSAHARVRRGMPNGLILRLYISGSAMEENIKPFLSRDPAINRSELLRIRAVHPKPSSIHAGDRPDVSTTFIAVRWKYDRDEEGNEDGDGAAYLNAGSSRRDGTVLRAAYTPAPGSARQTSASSLRMTYPRSGDCRGSGEPGGMGRSSPRNWPRVLEPHQRKWRSLLVRKSTAE